MKKLIVSNSFGYKKIALVKGDKLEDFYLEDNYDNISYIGNIYLGKVVEVLSGMQAIFVDIGLSKNAYMYIDDLLTPKFLYEKGIEKNNIDNINQVVKKGEEIIVQVKRDSVGSKSVAVTTAISLEGKSIALLVKNKLINVSKKIKNKTEKNRLYSFGNKILEDNCGMIFRTCSYNLDNDILEEEYNQLLNQYNKIEKESKYTIPPKLLVERPSFIENIFMNYINNIGEVYVDNKDDELIIKKCIKKYNCFIHSDINVIINEVNLFDIYNINTQLNNLADREVKLINGGSIVIDTTEAMTVIDVNSGSYIGESLCQDDTSLQTNLVALNEIVRQVRLRNISGIIIVDFINFNDKKYVDILVNKAREVFLKDNTKTKVLGMTRLNLMEITRKRSINNFCNILYEKCEYCRGHGRLPSDVKIMLQIDNIVKNTLYNTSCNYVEIKCSKRVLNKVNTSLKKRIELIEKKSKIKLKFVINENNIEESITIDKICKIN